MTHVENVKYCPNSNIDIGVNIYVRGQRMFQIPGDYLDIVILDGTRSGSHPICSPSLRFYGASPVDRADLTHDSENVFL